MPISESSGGKNCAHEGDNPILPKFSQVMITLIQHSLSHFVVKLCIPPLSPVRTPCPRNKHVTSEEEGRARPSSDYTGREIASFILPFLPSSLLLPLLLLRSWRTAFTLCHSCQPACTLNDGAEERQEDRSGEHDPAGETPLRAGTYLCLLFRD